jgi:hypothetical protein
MGPLFHPAPDTGRQIGIDKRGYFAAKSQLLW